MGEIVNGTWVSDYSGAEIDERLSRATPEGTVGRNLLDNAYFIGGGTAGQFPVNQRGQTGASAYPNEGGTVDRWVQPAGCITGWENGVFTVKLAGYYSSFRQYLDESALTEGQKYTLSVVSVTGLHSFTFTASKSTGAQSEGYENGLYFYVAWVSDTSKWLVNLATNGAQSSTLISFQPKAAKLELGNRQTLARQVNGAWVLNDAPPDYGQELAKCQRYLQIIQGGQNAFVLGSGFMNTATEARFTVPLTVPMAAINQIVEDSSIVFNVGGTWVTTGISNVHILNQQDSELYMSATLSSAMTQFAIVVACLDFSKTLLFSAE